MLTNRKGEEFRKTRNKQIYTSKQQWHFLLKSILLVLPNNIEKPEKGSIA